MQKNFFPNSQTAISSAWKKQDGEDFAAKAESELMKNLAKRTIELHSMNSITQMATHQGKGLD